ncbi:hypothetical protein ACTAQJ_14640 [Arthrobacter sp. alpha11c]
MKQHPELSGKTLGGNAPQSDYLTRSEAASYMNVPAHWLANNTKSGPPIIKIGGLVRYSAATLDAYMAAHECRQ